VRGDVIGDGRWSDLATGAAVSAQRFEPQLCPATATPDLQLVPLSPWPKSRIGSAHGVFSIRNWGKVPSRHQGGAARLCFPGGDLESHLKRGRKKTASRRWKCPVFRVFPCKTKFLW
jgi:hypothetical protein